MLSKYLSGVQIKQGMLFCFLLSIKMGNSKPGELMRLRNGQIKQAVKVPFILCLHPPKQVQ